MHLCSFKVYNDIALVRLPRRARYNGMVQPTCLPYNEPEVEEALRIDGVRTGLDDQHGFVIGWGRTSNVRTSFDVNNVPSDVQQVANLTVMERNRCNERWGGRKIPQDSTQICFGGEALPDLREKISRKL